MKKRYLCPKHKESTPSAVAYADGYHCFGCGARGPLSELGVEAGERIEITYVEDLEASLERIRRLPLRSVRGFDLHHSDGGYYLIWPTGDYYKYRNLTATTPGGKYRGPSGHKKPWFTACEGSRSVVAVVEGEFNALSLAKACPRLSILSPGGAGDFFSKNAEKYLQNLTEYETVFLIADDDKAGAQACIEATAKLKSLGMQDVRIKLVGTDFNEIHEKDGLEKLKEEARKLGLPGGNL